MELPPWGWLAFLLGAFGMAIVIVVAINAVHTAFNIG